MSTHQKVVITHRAAIARFRRHLAKSNQKLITFRIPVDSIYHFGIVDIDNNTVEAIGDFSTVETWMREDLVLKPYEAIGQ